MCEQDKAEEVLLTSAQSLTTEMVEEISPLIRNELINKHKQVTVNKFYKTSTTSRVNVVEN